MKIYRYISLSQFLFIVENKKLYLRKITSWPDPLDGRLASHKLRETYQIVQFYKSLCEEVVAKIASKDSLHEMKQTCDEFQSRQKQEYSDFINRRRQENSELISKLKLEYSFNSAFIDELAALNDQDPTTCFVKIVKLRIA